MPLGTVPFGSFLTFVPLGTVPFGSFVNLFNCRVVSLGVTFFLRMLAHELRKLFLCQHHKVCSSKG